jgi:hypothetical protein
MRRLALVVLILSVCVTLAAQTQVRGQVVNRDGAAQQQCQVNFYLSDRQLYGVATDSRGFFVLMNPRYATYRVEVLQGNRREEFRDVIIDQNGLRPPTFVVPW